MVATMTTYFDKAHADLNRLRNDKAHLEWLRKEPGSGTFVIEDAVRLWEEKLVADCTITVYFPGYADLDPLPDKFKQAVNKTILSYGIYTLPDSTDPCLETPAQWWSRLGNLCWHLHEVFHSITQETGRSDSPLACRMFLVNQGYDDRDGPLNSQTTKNI